MRQHSHDRPNKIRNQQKEISIIELIKLNKTNVKEFLECNPDKVNKELKTKTIYSKYLKKKFIRLVIRLGLLNIFIYI